jgi:hypothetical protein
MTSQMSFVPRNVQFSPVSRFFMDGSLVAKHSGERFTMRWKTLSERTSVASNEGHVTNLLLFSNCHTELLVRCFNHVSLIELNQVDDPFCIYRVYRLGLGRSLAGEQPSIFLIDFRWSKFVHL